MFKPVFAPERMLSSLGSRRLQLRQAFECPRLALAHLLHSRPVEQRTCELKLLQDACARLHEVEVATPVLKGDMTC